MTDVCNLPVGDLLEIAVVTDNRTSLEIILGQLAETPLARMRITVFHSCREDASEAICSRFEANLPALAVVCHCKAPGSEAAFLHAVERVNAEYAWVLSDDVRYDFSGIDELLGEMGKKESAAFFTGAASVLDMPGGTECRLADFVAAGGTPFRPFIPWPALIFRTALFKEECLVKGYRLVNNFYSNFAFINSLLESSVTVYLAKQQHVLPDGVGRHAYADLYQVAGWVNCCQGIKSETVREVTIRDVKEGRSFFATVCSATTAVDDFGSKRFWIALIDLFWGAPKKDRGQLLRLFLLLVAPIPRSLRQSAVHRLAVQRPNG